MSALPNVGSSGNFFFVTDKDVQHYLYALYVGGLATTLPLGSPPIFKPDNEEVLKLGRGLLYPRKYMMLFYRYENGLEW